MISMDFSADFKRVERMFKNAPKIVEKATVSSLNKTNKNILTLANRLIAKQTGLSIRDIKKIMRTNKAKKNSLMASITSAGKELNLIRFKPRKTRRGVSATAWGKRKLYKGAFIANNGRTVFIRTSKNRLPIKPVFGPSIPKTMRKQAITMALRLKTNEQWPKNFNKDLSFFLGKRK